MRTLLAAAGLPFGLALAGGSASAAPVSISFDHGRGQIGGLFKDKDVLPATPTSPPRRPSPPATRRHPAAR